MVSLHEGKMNRAGHSAEFAAIYAQARANKISLEDDGEIHQFV
jgi:hypothetical protein